MKYSLYPDSDVKDRKDVKNSIYGSYHSFEKRAASHRRTNQSSWWVSISSSQQAESTFPNLPAAAVIEKFYGNCTQL